MEKEHGPFYFYKIFSIAAFICSGIFLVERSTKGALICFLLFTMIIFLALRKKKKLRKKEIV
ncbi:DUF5325 family protein [Niallia sp. 01092]|uniref:DUF5325 family protein n=1 Tax=unclassified Niallia TaxID=2837522 RepID=UPI003FD119C6